MKNKRRAKRQWRTKRMRNGHGEKSVWRRSSQAHSLRFWGQSSVVVPGQIQDLGLLATPTLLKNVLRAERESFEMTSVRVPIMFCGEWIKQNDHYRFNGTEARGIMVPRSTTYAQLIEKVSRIICIDISEFDIEIKFKLKTFDPMPPVPIMNDDDVDYFLEETISGAELKIPLCITYQRKQILVTPITHVDPNVGPDSCPEEHVEPYVEGECLSPNNFVAEDQSIFEFVPETQPNDRRSNEENVNVIVHDDVDGITVSDPTLGNVAHSNNKYMPRVNLFTCSSSFDTDNSHSNTINLPSTEVVGDSDWLMGKKLFSSKEELQQVLFMEALRKNFELKTFKSGKNILVVSVLTILKKNSGTCTFLEVDNANNFKYFFMAIGGCIHGFISSIRPVIAIDGTFLKGKFKGTLFIATALDGNNQLYPVTFGVGDSENDASWGWFLMKLKVAIGEVPNLVFISDRHPSIQKNVNIAFPNVAYGICTHYLKQNLRAKFKEIEVGAIVELAAKTYRPQHFNYFMNEIQKVDERVVKYLQDAGYEKWARCHFDGLRYSIMTTNIAESMNSVLKNPRQLPIHKLLDSIIDKLREWFCDRREEAVNCHTRLTKWAEKELLTKSENSRTYKVVTLNMYEFIVKDGDLNGHVNILDKTCSCREFQLDQLPCEHALAVCRYRETLSVYDMCSRYYSSEAWVAAYAETIYHVGTEEEWEVSEEVQSNEVLPLVEKRKKGRPQKLRIPSQCEEKLSRKCGRCGSRGHNRLTCSAPIPLSNNEPVVRPNET
ncbi:SWIM-type domain-containing protein [Citrus sinensis]|uniref:SWIM-type domain-containing protein n=1 Tax=Citrus sinensis TaxID=2711 RepID=A0ACB8MDE8_CITSI|nr:SWIM-type domain-containing protein [Citrus sinensis]